MENIINTLRDYGCKLTMYDFHYQPVLFCLAVFVDDPKEIWHIAMLCEHQGLEMGQPQYDAKVKCIYFPTLVLDPSSFDLIAA